MISVSIEKINDKYRWEVIMLGTPYASGLEETMTTAALAAEKVMEELDNGK